MGAEYSALRPGLRGQSRREGAPESGGRAHRGEVAGEQQPDAHAAVVGAAGGAAVGVPAHRRAMARRIAALEPGEVLGTEVGAAHRWGGGGDPVAEPCVPWRGPKRQNAPPVPREDVLRSGLRSVGGPTPLHEGVYRRAGSMISANELRARFSRDFTVPRLQCVISAISSYERPSSSRSTNTSR